MRVRRDLLHRERDLLRAAGLGQLDVIPPRLCPDGSGRGRAGPGAGRCSRRRRRRSCRSAGTASRSRRSGSSCPSQNIHPAGREVPAEHPDLADVWLCHGSASSVPAREDALQGDAEAQRQERLHVEVCLAAAGVRDRRRGSWASGSRVLRRRCSRCPGSGSSDCRFRPSRSSTRPRCERAWAAPRWSACAPAWPAASPSVWAPSTWIGTRARRSGSAKCRLPVPAVGRAEQREQRLVLVDRQKLPVAERPALGREDEGHDPDLA